MGRNMGTADRVIRIALGVLVIALYFMGRISGTVAIVLLVFAGVFIVTSFIAWCPAYAPFGFSTRGKPKG